VNLSSYKSPISYCSPFAPPPGRTQRVKCFLANIRLLQLDVAEINPQHGAPTAYRVITDHKPERPLSRASATAARDTLQCKRSICRRELSFLTKITTGQLRCPTGPRRLRPRSRWQKCGRRSCSTCKADPLGDRQMHGLPLPTTLIVQDFPDLRQSDRATRGP
jgi:hypothetical protein